MDRQGAIAVEQARLLVLKTAWLIGPGNREARTENSAIKAAVPRGVCWVLDDAMQAHGGAGVGDDAPLGRDLRAIARTLRIADGPDEVHTMVVARSELRKH